MKDLSTIVESLKCAVCRGPASGVVIKPDGKIIPFDQGCFGQTLKSLELASRIGSMVLTPGQVIDMQKSKFVSDPYTLNLHRDEIRKLYDEEKTRQVVEE